MLKYKITLISLVLGFAQLTLADQGKIDIGEDIMKPMGKLAKQIATDIGDATKNRANVESIKKIEGYLDQALLTNPATKELVAVPDTDHYKAEVALVGAELAVTKYSSLLKSARVTWLELELILTAAGDKACAKDCADKLNQIKELQDVAHSVFRDPDP